MVTLITMAFNAVLYPRAETVLHEIREQKALQIKYYIEGNHGHIT